LFNSLKIEKNLNNNYLELFWKPSKLVDQQSQHISELLVSSQIKVGRSSKDNVKTLKNILNLINKYECQEM